MRISMKWDEFAFLRLFIIIWSPKNHLFGGLGVVFISKNVKLSIAPIVLMLVLFIFVPALNKGTVGIMVPVGVLFTLGVARIMYKKGWL